MSRLNIISGLFKKKGFNEFDTENYQRYILLSFSLFFSSLLNVSFSAYHLIFNEKSIAFGLMVFALLFLLFYFYYRKTDNYKIASLSGAVLLTVEFALIAFIGIGDEMSGIFWGLIFPVILSLTVTRGKFILFSAICLAFVLIIFFIPVKDVFPEYSGDIVFRFFMTYMTVFIFLLFYSNIKQQVYNAKEKKNLEFQTQIGNKNRFLSDISYQIRLPLNNIAGIIHHKRNALGEETVENIELSIGNIISVMNSIPMISSQSLIPIKGNETGFNINNVIRKSVDLFQAGKYGNLKISLYLSSRTPSSVYGDRLSLIQILISSIDYFYDKLGLDTKLEIISKEKSDETVLVQFKAKYKNSNHNQPIIIYADKSSDKDLKYIYDMVESINALLDVSVEDQNLSFTFNFNFTSSLDISKPDTSTEDINNDYFKESRKKIEMKDANILLVEDDEMNSKVMTLNLEKLVKKIIIAKNGKEAIEKFTTTKTDLILMDIRMPLMDGFKATEKIREIEKGTNIRTPIIAVTAFASSETMQQCLDAGMNDYTTKPVNFNILINKIEALIN
jgi:CheY-like chemotaxis protein